MSFLHSSAKLTVQSINLSMNGCQALGGRRLEDREVLYERTVVVAHHLKKRVLVSGEDIVDTEADYDPLTAEHIVKFRLDLRGTRRIAEASQDSIGRPLAFLLNGQVIAAPIIKEAILSWVGTIFRQLHLDEEVRRLASFLRIAPAAGPFAF